MNYKLYSIKDKLMNFTGPIAFPDEKTAVRWFEGECKRRQKLDFTSSKYYDLYEIGTFNPEEGTIVGWQLSQLKLIKEGAEFDEQTNEG